MQIDTKSALEVLPSDLEDEDEEDAFEVRMSVGLFRLLHT